MEFILLFLAVYLGFLTENLRSENDDRQKEEYYILSLLKDLKNDTSKLTTIIRDYDTIIAQQQILLNTFSKLENGFSSEFHNNLIGLYWHPDFVYTDVTLQQLKYSGGFRLMQNARLIEQILEYDAVVSGARINEQILARSLEENHREVNEIYNWQEFAKRDKEAKNAEQLEREKFNILLHHDSYLTSKFYNQMRHHNILTISMREEMLRIKMKCQEILKYIENSNSVNN